MQYMSRTFCSNSRASHHEQNKAINRAKTVTVLARDISGHGNHEGSFHEKVEYLRLFNQFEIIFLYSTGSCRLNFMVTADDDV